MMIVTQREEPASVRIPACPDRPARLGKESVQAFQSGFQQFTVQQSAIAAHGLGQVAGQALPDLRGRALIKLQGFFQKMQRVRVHRPGGGGRQEKQGTVGLLMRTEIAVQRVVGKPPALMHATR